jgi:hypothetical protein
MRSKEEQEQIVKRALSMPSEGDGKPDVTEGRIIAVLIDSPIVGGLVWFAFHDTFKSSDDTPVFFASELPFLRTMSPDELRRRYAEKRALGGGWIRDRIEEPSKH